MSGEEEQEVEPAPKGSRSPYARIRTSFVAKFGNLLAARHAEDTEPSDDTTKQRRKTAAKVPEVDPADLQEVKLLVKEGQEPDSRRGALLALFKLSLRENLLEVMIQEGALDVLVLGLNQEAKGSGARRAAMQTVRNLAAHVPNHPILLDSVIPAISELIEDETPGSGPRIAALEALVNLAANPKSRERLKTADNLVHSVLLAAKTEPQGTQGRESALCVFEYLSQAPKKSETPAAPRRVVGQPSKKDQIDEEEDEEKFDIPAIVGICLETASKEPKGSPAKIVAMRTLRNLAAGKYRSKIATTPSLYDTTLTAAREDGPGSETRSLVFALFSELSNDESNREQLMKTATLVDTVITAVRDEATGSPVREHAMFTIANLCLEPQNRAVFMQGSADLLITVCVRASNQEAAGSGGRAAALELCTALAMAEEYREKLFKSSGLLNLAVESAYSDKSDRVKKAGLGLITAVCLESNEYRSVVFKIKHANEAVVAAACSEEESEIQAAGLAALRALCRSTEIRTALRKSTLEKVLEVTKSARTGSKSKSEALCCLEEGLFDQWNDSKLSYLLVESCAHIIKQERPGSEIKIRSCSLLRAACEHQLEKVVLQSGAPLTLVSFLREYSEVISQSNSANAKDLYSRASLRRTPLSKNNSGTTTEMALDCVSSIKTLVALIRREIVPEGTLGACQGLLKLLKDSLAEPKDLFDSSVIEAIHYVAVSAVPANCSNLPTAREFAGNLAAVSLDPFVKRLDGIPEDGSPIITAMDAAEAIYTLSAYQNCVENHFGTLVTPIAKKICNLSDNEDTPRLQEVLCKSLLQCLFVPALADPLKVSDIRSTLDQVLIRLGNRGGEEFEYSAAGRAAQAIVIGFKVIHLQEGHPPPAGKDKYIAILCVRDGLLLAKRAEEGLRKIKGVTCKVEESEWFGDKSAWEKIPLKLRKGHLDHVVMRLKQARGVVVCSSKGVERDPIVRMLAEFAVASGIPAIVCIGQETQSNTCYGSWLEGFRAKCNTIEVSQISTWKPFETK